MAEAIMEPLISVVIPAYNRAAVIGRAINSVIGQQFTEWELIVVDDGSGDNTSDVVRTFLGDQRIFYVRTENGGAPRARNVGMGRARGKWIVFLDSDDELLPDYLLFFIRNTSNEFIAYYSNYNRINQYSVQSVLSPELLNRDDFLLGNPVGGFSCMVFSKESLLKEGGHDENLPARQDADLYYRLLENHKFRKLEVVGCNIYTTSDGRISSNNERRFRGWFLFYKKHAKTMSVSKRLKIAWRVLRMTDVKTQKKEIYDIFLIIFGK